jgi:hypothetical protein
VKKCKSRQSFCVPLIDDKSMLPCLYRDDRADSASLIPNLLWSALQLVCPRGCTESAMSSLRGSESGDDKKED